MVPRARPTTGYPTRATPIGPQVSADASPAATSWSPGGHQASDAIPSQSQHQLVHTADQCDRLIEHVDGATHLAGRDEAAVRQRKRRRDVE